jgi:UDP-N-acetyl-D-mannosaminouronate:lipid I N-acetyl-D-mannosaminouronosyltransferase
MSNLVQNINGFKVYGFDSRDKLISHIKTKPSILIAINAEKIYAGNNELKLISQNGVGYPDGIGAVKALKTKGARKAVRIPGSELWLDIISTLNNEDSVYLIGATNEVIEATVDKLNQIYPSLEIAGYRNGFLNESDIVTLEKDILDKKPTVVFVAQGSPRQERLMQRLQLSHKAIYMGLGGSFDVFTGNVSRAPRLFRENGLEWLYRLLSQPSRIKRQKVLLPFFINLHLGKY